MRIAEAHAAADVRQKDHFSMTPILGQIASLLISCFGLVSPYSLPSKALIVQPASLRAAPVNLPVLRGHENPSTPVFFGWFLL
jgi:hypothetical protein